MNRAAVCDIIYENRAVSQRAGAMYYGTVDIGCYECYLPCEGTMVIFR